MECVQTISAFDDDYVSIVKFSPDGRSLLSSRSSTVKIWSVASAELQTEIQTFANFSDMSYFPSGRYLLGCSVPSVWLLDARKGEPVDHFSIDVNKAFLGLALASEKQFVTYSRDNYLRFFEFGSMKPISKPKKFKGSDGPLACSPDTTRCAVGSSKTISLWDTVARTELKLLNRHVKEVISLAFSPDGTTLASSGADRRIAFWNVATGKLIHEIEFGKKQNVSALAYLGRGAALVSMINTGNGQGYLTVWDTKTYQPITQSDAHQAPVSVAASPSGALTAAASGYGGHIRIWADAALSARVPPTASIKLPPYRGPQPIAREDPDQPDKLIKLALCSSNLQVRTAASLQLLELGKYDDSEIVKNPLHVLGHVQPLIRPVAEAFSKNLSSEEWWLCGPALHGLTGLPADLRSEWIPALLDNLHRFENSDHSCIIRCLAAHYDEHRERVEQVLRAELKSKERLGSYYAFEVLHKLGPKASSMVPAILEYISREKAFCGQDVFLNEIDPEGTVAIPGLIKLINSRKDTVRSKALWTLATYKGKAHAALVPLNKLLKKFTGHEAKVIQMCIDAIEGK